MQNINILPTYSYTLQWLAHIIEQRELEILLDLWAPSLIQLTSFISTRVQVSGCNNDNSVISSVIHKIGFYRISAKINLTDRCLKISGEDVITTIWIDVYIENFIP